MSKFHLNRILNFILMTGLCMDRQAIFHEEDGASGYEQTTMAEENAAVEKENFADADISDILGDTSSSASLDSILNPTASADDADLSEFLNDTPDLVGDLSPAGDDALSLEDLAPEPEEKTEEKPLEDMDFNSLIGDISPL